MSKGDDELDEMRRKIVGLRFAGNSYEAISGRLGISRYVAYEIMQDFIGLIKK